MSSRNMYSEHGFDALIRPEAGQVCQSLIVVSYWMPGSALAQAANAIFCQSSFAFSVLATLPSVRRTSPQSLPSSMAATNSSPTRTVLFEFWPETVR